MRSLLLILVLPVMAHAHETQAGEIPPRRAAELENLVKQDCGSCHGLTRKGGLGPDIRAEALVGYAPNDLSEIIKNGIPGAAMPPWGPLLSDAEITWISEYLLKETGE